MAFETPTAGLRANNEALGIVAQNVANSKNNGIKHNNYVFHNTIAGNAVATGNFTPGTVSVKMTQNNDLLGPIKDSTADTHMAFDSPKGFFVVTGSRENPLNDIRFTRDGDFTPDANGDLKNSAGFYLMGWRLNDFGQIPFGTNTGELDSLEIVNVTRVSATSTPSTELDIRVNLPASVTNGGALGDTHQVTSRVVDSQGVSHAILLTYTKTANPNEWDLTITSPDAATVTQIGGANAGSAYDNMTIQFDTNGRLVSYNGVPAEVTPPGAEFDWAIGAAANSTITLNFGEVGANSALRVQGDQFFTSRNQDNGRPFSTVDGTFINTEGEVSSVFRDSSQQKIFTISVAIFDAPNQLEPQSGNTFTETINSGNFVLGRANDAGFAKIISGKLEGNTTNLADELIKMIDLQHTYAANARSVSTEDKMLEELKRL